MPGLFEEQLAIGIDISDHSIEVVQLNEERKVSAYGRAILKKGLVRNGRIYSPKKLAKKLKRVLERTKPIPLKAGGAELKAILSLPEARVFIHRFELPQELGGEELRQRVFEEASRLIPFDPQQQIYRDYIELPQKPKIETEGQEEQTLAPEAPSLKPVLYVGALKEIVDGYIEVMRLAGVEPIVLDIESVSLGRALLSSEPPTANVSSMIVDIGARTTILSIFDSSGFLNLSVTIPIAGGYFTKQIADKLKITVQEAEKLKRTYGFNEEKVGKKVLSIVQPTFREILRKTKDVLELDFERIIEEIKAAIQYYEGKSGESITEIILAGGSALLPGVDEYLAANVERKVSIGNPLKKIQGGEILGKRKPPVLYANVIGLALRALEESPEKAGINLIPPKRGPAVLAAKEPPAEEPPIKERPQPAPVKRGVDRGRIRDKFSKSRILSFLAVLLTIAALALLGWGFYNYISKSARKAPPITPVMED